MRRILLVEDSPTTRAFVRATLGAHRASLGPVEVVEAASGFEALRLFPRGQYQLVISDINMPDVNGLELVRFIRSQVRHTSLPIVLISTLSSDKELERGLSLGANAFLKKPFSEQQLVDIVASQLSVILESEHG